MIQKVYLRRSCIFIDEIWSSSFDLEFSEARQYCIKGKRIAPNSTSIHNRHSIIFRSLIHGADTFHLTMSYPTSSSLFLPALYLTIFIDLTWLLSITLSCVPDTLHLNHVIFLKALSCATFLYFLKCFLSDHYLLFCQMILLSFSSYSPSSLLSGFPFVVSPSLLTHFIRII